MMSSFTQLVTRWEAWICPPASADQAQHLHEVQRRRISGFLPPILALGALASFMSTIALAQHGHALIESVGIFLSPLVMIAICFTLCHLRYARASAVIFQAAITLFLLWRTLAPLNANEHGLGATMLLYLPICSAGILLSARASWIQFGLIQIPLVLFAFHRTPSFTSVVMGCLPEFEILVIGTAMIALGMRGLHHALRTADRSQELAALYQQLEASVQEIAAREIEVKLQRNFADAMLDNIAPDIFIVLDHQGHILRCNDAFLRLFGWEREEIIGGSTRCMHKDSADYMSVIEPLLQELHQQGHSMFEHVYVTKQGRQIHLASNVATHSAMGVYIVVGRDVTEERHIQRNMEILRKIGQACASAAEEMTVARAALGTLLDGLGFVSGSIVTQDTTRLGYARPLAFISSPDVPAASQAKWLRLLEKSPIAPDAPIASLRALATGEFVSDVQYVFDQDSAFVMDDTPGLTAIGVPLQFEGEMFGALGMAFPLRANHSLEAADRELIVVAAQEIATSLHRARLYDRAQSLALIDPLTNLHNHRALQASLAQEIAKGTVHLPVSVIMLDIDHFRKFNEVHGHEVGDRALRGIASAITSVVRDTDVAARYGGEEFVILLPATDADHANLLAERIRTAIAERPITIDTQTGELRAITASIGHATYPMHASAASSLLKAADLALYSAKRSGRNAVAAYSPNMLESSAPLLPFSALQSADAAEAAGDITLPTGADLDTVQAFITAIDLRDGYTAAHSDGVSRYAVAIGMELGLPTEHIEALRLGGLIHDIGKIGVPDGVLRKPGKLDAEEWAQMQAHTTMGAEILRHVEKLHHLLPLVRWHHERLDGSGYPDGLRGEQIPLLVRILSVADVFEAFTAERPYHPGRSATAGLLLLQQEVQANRMDAAVVQAFEDMLICQGLIEDYAHGEQDMRQAA